MATDLLRQIRQALRHAALLTLTIPAVLIAPAVLAQDTERNGGAASASRVVAVVVHADTPTGRLSRADLLDLYLGDVRFWSDGTRVVLFDQGPSTDVKESFYDYLGRSISRMKSLWLRRRLAGEGNPPEALSSDADVLARIADTPGSIGFVRADRARGSEGVRVVRLLPIK